MKNHKGNLIWGVTAGVFLTMLFASAGNSAFAAGTPPAKQKTPEYVVVGWNNLGMHCINPTYDKLVILPPANTLMVQVIKRGNPPTLVTKDVQLSYRIENNTTSSNKCNFWQYVKKIFGVRLSPNTGLTGNRMVGNLTLNGDHYEASAIPVLPVNNGGAWNPYQVAVVTMRDKKGTVMTNRVVLPVSDELHCDQCHAPGGDGTMNIISTTSIEENILRVHDFYHPEFNLTASEPVLCSSCHADPALGLPGKAGCKSLSHAMHGWHQQSMDATCYSCHPGPNTNCLRSDIPAMGPVGGDPQCERCHGTLQDMATSLDNGRQPWAQEPTCIQCHDQIFDTSGTLYRESSFHGVRCVFCHNSPHAWWPSLNALDNLQPMALQKSSHALRDCSVCHTTPKTGTSPHPAHGPGVPTPPPAP